jgi:medium-chain acyl-[acyl-carrier-protein] hydrolase
MNTLTTRPTSAGVSCPRPNPQALLRLFCFPYAGGGASVFRAWPNDLPPTIEVCAIQYPGRENRMSEPLLSSSEPLVEALITDIQPYLDRPYAFFGHSLGALVAFELARQIDQARQPPLIHLFVSAHAAPQIVNTDPPIHQLPQAEFIRKIADLNGTPDEILSHTELMELLYPILRADFTMNETYAYRAGSPLDCSISALGGLRDSLVSRAQLEAWGEQTHGSFAVRMFPGHHFFLSEVRPLLLRIIAQDLLQSLSRFQGNQVT